MIVAELIKILERCPPDYEVLTFDWDDDEYVLWDERYITVLDEAKVIYV